MVASARLHRINPEDYIRWSSGWCRSWPEDRMLKRARRFWQRTRARLDPTAFAMELGPIAIPAEPLDTSAATEQQATG
jgi:transposase